MNRFPSAVAHLPALLVHVLGLPAFYILFLLVYEPAPMVQLLQAGKDLYPAIGSIFIFNLPITASILLLVLLASRISFLFLSKTQDLTLLRYGLWCLGEMFLASAFVALYLVLMAKGEPVYFIGLGKTFSALLSILVYPYLIVALYYAWEGALHRDWSVSDVRLKFYDSRHQLKFVCSSKDLLYIASDENYIRIHYRENGGFKEFVLRSSMKSVEPLCQQAGFVRTHRCYIVNPSFIKSIKKDGSGFFFVDLGTGEAEGIPVSKKYYDAVAAVL